MKYILDTDTLICFLEGHEEVVERMSRVVNDAFGTTIINHAELLLGAFNSEREKDNLKKINMFLDKMTIVRFCQEAAAIFAEQKMQLKKYGNSIADLDLMIASIALTHKSILVTNNVEDFSRIKKLNIESWTQ